MSTTITNRVIDEFYDETRGVADDPVLDALSGDAGYRTLTALLDRAVHLSALAEKERIKADLEDEVRDALEGDSNDAEHEALYGVASYFGIEYRDPYDDYDDEEEDDE